MVEFIATDGLHQGGTLVILDATLDEKNCEPFFAKFWRGKEPFAKIERVNKATEITSRDKQLAGEIWALVEKDYLAVGNVLFRELFTTYPDYLKYFEGMKASPDQDIFQSARFKKHMVSALFPSIALLLQNLDHPDRLAEQVREIGATHKKRDVHREQFENLHKIFIITLKKTLPEKFTPEAEAAWNKILGVSFDMISSYL